MVQGQRHNYVSLQQSLSSVKVKHGGNKVGPEPQRIFGSPLDIDTKDTTHQSVPLVVQHTVEYLEEFGKFMISLGCDHFLPFRWTFSTQGSVFALGQEVACILGINIAGNGVHSMSLMKRGSGYLFFCNDCP